MSGVLEGCTVLDLPPVIDVTEKSMADHPLRSRVELGCQKN